MDDTRDLMMRVLQAGPDHRAEIERALNGEPPSPAATLRSGPLLLRMKEGAQLIGVSRPTFWRICRAGKLERIEILPNSFRVRREDVEALAGYRSQGGGAQ